MSAEDSEETPQDFICPISQEIMEDPVVIQSGMSYDRSSILEWFSHGNETCPMTRQKVQTDVIVSNVALKKAIAHWQTEKRTVQVPSTAPATPVDVAGHFIVKSANAGSISEQPSLKAMIRAVEQGNNTEQVHALRWLQQHLWSSAQANSEVVALGGIPLLLSITQAATTSARWYASQVLEVLASDTSRGYLEEIVSMAAGGVRASWPRRASNCDLPGLAGMLVNEMTGKDMAVKERAAWSLWALCLEASVLQRMCGPRMVAVLTQLLCKGSPGAKVAATGVVQQVAGAAGPGGVRIDLRPTVKPLVAQLKDPDGICLLSATAAIAKLVELNDCRWPVLTNGGFTSLIDIVRGSEGEELQAFYAAMAIEASAQDVRCKAAISKGGGVLALVQLLKADNELMCTASASALYRLADNDDAIKLIVGNAEATPVLLSCLRSRNQEVKFAAARLLAVLCLNLRNALRFPSVGIKSLVDLLESLDERCRFFAAVALLGLSYASVRFQSEVGAAGATRPLLHSLSSYSPRCQYIAASLLKQLAKLEENRAFIVQAGGVHVLLDAVNNQPQGDCNAEAAGALQHLAEGCEEYKEKILQAGGLEMLLQMFVDATQACQQPSVCAQAAALALLALVDQAAVRETLKESGYLELVAHVAAGSREARGAVPDALLHCATY